MPDQTKDAGIEVISQLGSGTFGVVRKVCVRGQLLAAKSVTEGFEMERTVLGQIRHSSIIGFFGCVLLEGKDTLLLELAREDLTSRLARGLLSRHETAFYTTCIVSGLEALHSRSILYMDLKPSNCLIDQEGYLKLADFNSSCFLNDAWGVRGTYEYMAPEVARGERYGAAADYYSLGVCMYEFIDGYTEKKYHAILAGQDIEFSQAFYDDDANCDLYVLITDLVWGDPQYRLQTISVLRHDFFLGLQIDIDAIIQRRALPPKESSREANTEQLGLAASHYMQSGGDLLEPMSTKCTSDLQRALGSRRREVIDCGGYDEYGPEATVVADQSLDIVGGEDPPVHQKRENEAGACEATSEGIEVISQLGSGAFGVVRKVCVQGQFLAAKSVTEGFQMERTVLEQIRHSSIIGFFGCMLLEGKNTLLLELAREDLTSRLNRGLLSRHETAFYTTCIVSGLEALHALSILYMDLKPSNCLIDQEGYLKLADFNSSCFLSDAWGVRGTYEYMAPEVARGERYGAAADYYSLGVCMYEFVDGYTEEKYHALLAGQEVKFAQAFYDDDTNSDLYLLITELLWQDPQYRPQTISMLRHDFFLGLQIDIDAIIQRRALPPKESSREANTEQLGLAASHYMQSGGDLLEPMSTKCTSDLQRALGSQRREVIDCGGYDEYGPEATVVADQSLDIVGGEGEDPPVHQKRENEAGACEAKSEGIEVISQLGSGAFGVVRKVCIQGHLLAAKTLTEGFQMERTVLEQIQHPFIIGFFGCVQLEGKDSLLLELAREDLTSRLSRGLLTRDETAFYTTCIVSGLDALHGRSVLYMDLKPSNCLIDQAGYLKLADFNSSCSVNDAWGVRGTYEYMAPEVARGGWYGAAADYYSLGICMYEFIDGYTEKKYHAILAGRDIEFTQAFYDDDANCDLYVLINDLLWGDPQYRLQTISVLRHDFFLGLQIDIDAILQRRALPPKEFSREATADQSRLGMPGGNLEPMPPKYSKPDDAVHFDLVEAIDCGGDDDYGPDATLAQFKLAVGSEMAKVEEPAWKDWCLDGELPGQLQDEQGRICDKLEGMKTLPHSQMETLQQGADEFREEASMLDVEDNQIAVAAERDFICHTDFVADRQDEAELEDFRSELIAGKATHREHSHRRRQKVQVSCCCWAGVRRMLSAALFR